MMILPIREESQHVDIAGNEEVSKPVLMDDCSAVQTLAAAETGLTDSREIISLIEDLRLQAF